MSFKLKIKNFGKLSDAEISIGQFTVFAGPNNTGKSSVSKLLYSLFDGMNANHALVYFNSLVKPLRNHLRTLEGIGYDGEDLKIFVDEIDKMGSLIKSCPIDNFEEIENKLPDIVGSVRKLCASYETLKQNVVKWSQKQKLPGLLSSLTNDQKRGILDGIDTEFNALYDNIKEANASNFVTGGIQNKILHNLIENFQVSSLSYLRTKQESGSEVSIDSVGKFEFTNSNLVSFNIKHVGLQQLQEYSRVIYLESPLYWKLKLALENVRISPRFFHFFDRERISGVPGYFYDLASALKVEYTGDVAFPELYGKLISKKVLGGKITISETGELNFQENERNFSLHLTAMGVVNLGILALLIERKIIDRGTFLFIDEPEAHLHPAWQVKMAKTLFELSREGVNVVIATHSADILQFLEVEAKKNPEYKESIALNHFSSQGVRNYESDFDIKLANIQKELTEPFAELYIRGV